MPLLLPQTSSSSSSSSPQAPATTTMPSSPTPSSSSSPLIPLCHIITPVGCLGYGLDESVTDRELARLFGPNESSSGAPAIPIAIILDSGSTDSGPARLGLGKMNAPRSSYERDLGKLVHLVHKYPGVKLMFSSAGGDGAGEHLDEIVKVIREIIEGSEESYKTSLLTLHSDMAPALIHTRLSSSRISSCGPTVPELTPSDVDSATRILAQMGPDAFLPAMFARPGFDILAAGRAHDPAPFIAFAAFCYQGLFPCSENKDILASLPPTVLGGFAHLGQILECGGQCATPKSRAARATLYTDGTFDVHPLDEGAMCTERSVAAHGMYEKSRADILFGPGGFLDLTRTSYEALIDGQERKTGGVRVKGGVYEYARREGKPYTVKLEGAKIDGYRAMYFGAFRDGQLTKQLDVLLEMVRTYAADQHRHVADEKWDIRFHKFGQMGGEVALLGEVWAEKTQALASSVAQTARVACIHGPYPGQKATSGNFAFGLGGMTEIECGPCAQFCVYHLMELDEGEEGSREKGGQDEGKGLFVWDEMVLGVNDRPKEMDASSIEGMDASDGKTKPRTEIPVPTADSTASASHTSNTTITAAAKNPSQRKRKHDSTVPETLGDTAAVVRSKNAGPYEITFDVLFDSDFVYKTIKNAGILTPSAIASLYSLENENEIIYCGFFDQGRAFKATIPRMSAAGKRSVSGGFGDDDVHGSQKYLPLMGLELPEGVRSTLLKGEGKDE